MVRPTEFFKDWEASKVSQSNISNENYQKKILLKYFSTMVEDYDLKDIFYDKSVVNKLEEVKHKVSKGFFQAIDIKKYPKVDLLMMYRNIRKFPIWKDLIALIEEHGEAGIIFPLYKNGNYILHNFARQPDDVLKEPKIIWPGNSGSDLTLEKLDVFLIEYKAGE
jgi:hypothetical protein